MLGHPKKETQPRLAALSLTSSKPNNYRDSDLWLRDASYIRLKNIEMGYSFSKAVLKKLHVGSLRLSLSGYNAIDFR